jgi:hypothetical protein
MHVPLMSFLDFITKMEDAFVANFSVFSKSSCNGKHLLAKLENFAVSFQMCENFPLDYLRKLFLRMRIYYCLKFANNRDFSSTKSKCKGKDKKYINVTEVKGLGPQLKAADTLLSHELLYCSSLYCSETVPSEWKLSRAIPPHKNGPRNMLNNYRQIFILPIVSR